MEYKFKHSDQFGNDYEVVLKNKKSCVEIKMITSRKPLYAWKDEDIICDFINSSRKSPYEYYFSKYDYHTSYNFVNKKVEQLEKELKKMKFMRSIIGKKINFTNPSEFRKED